MITHKEEVIINGFKCILLLMKKREDRLVFFFFPRKMKKDDEGPTVYTVAVRR